MEKLYSLFLDSKGVCIDSRKLCKGEIFFALKGENFDGNKFAQTALDNGAAAVVVDDTSKLDTVDDRIVAVEVVQDCLVALAKYHRAKLNIPVIGITGSNGKTTTKELLHAVLSKKFKCSATKGNFNNHIGVPLTLLDIDSSIEIAIVEMGANHQGEIDFLSQIAAPSHGLITNIGKAHLEGFGGIEGVKKGKSELYRFLAKTSGHIFINTDDEVLSSLIPGNCEALSQYSSSSIHVQKTFPELEFVVDGVKICSKLTGTYNIHNIAAAIAVGTYFDVTQKDTLDAIAQYLPSNNRSQIKVIGSNTYILDSYNANPTSMLLSVQNLADGSETKQSVLILGDMKEVGAEEISEHESVLESVKKYNWKAVYTVGDIFYSLNNNPFHSFESVEMLNQYLDKNPIKDSIVLLKASRSIGLDRVDLNA